MLQTQHKETVKHCKKKKTSILIIIMRILKSVRANKNDTHKTQL